jgi:hypothetical protein
LWTTILPNPDLVKNQLDAFYALGQIYWLWILACFFRCTDFVYRFQYTELLAEVLTDGSYDGGHGNGSRRKGLAAIDGNSDGWQQLDSNRRLARRDSRQGHTNM